VIAGHAVSTRFPRVVEQNVEVRFQGRVQKQTYSENDYLLRYYGCLRETIKKKTRNGETDLSVLA